MKRMVAFFGFVLVAAVIGMSTSNYAGPGPLKGTCGDVNYDGVIDSLDITIIVNYVFSGTPIPGSECADVNSDGKINAGDAVYLANYLYKGGPAPSCNTINRP
jgi:hypothetical protein